MEGVRAAPELADGFCGEERDGYGAVGSDRRAGGQMGMQNHTWCKRRFVSLS